MKRSATISRLAAATLGDPRWAAVLARDPAADGTIVYSVATTGVVCRTSCRARSARPENVRFHPTAADAQRAGFRPCKRCRPNQDRPATRHADRVVELCRLIERAEISACRSGSVRCQCAGGGDPVPPRGAYRRQTDRLPLGRGAQTRAARTGSAGLSDCPALSRRHRAG